MESLGALLDKLADRGSIAIILAIFMFVAWRVVHTAWEFIKPKLDNLHVMFVEHFKTTDSAVERMTSSMESIARSMDSHGIKVDQQHKKVEEIHPLIKEIHFHVVEKSRSRGSNDHHDP